MKVRTVRASAAEQAGPTRRGRPSAFSDQAGCRSPVGKRRLLAVCIWCRKPRSPRIPRSTFLFTGEIRSLRVKGQGVERRSRARARIPYDCQETRVVAFTVVWTPTLNNRGVSVLRLDSRTPTPKRYSFPGVSFKGSVLHSPSGRTGPRDITLGAGKKSALSALETALDAPVDSLPFPVFVVLWMRGPRRRGGRKVFDAYVTTDAPRAASLADMAKEGEAAVCPELWPSRWRAVSRSRRHEEKKARAEVIAKSRPTPLAAQVAKPSLPEVTLDRLDGTGCPQGKRHRANVLFVRADVQAEMTKPRQGTRPRTAIFQDTCGRCRVAVVRREPLFGEGTIRRVPTKTGRAVFSAIASGRLRYDRATRSYEHPSLP